MYISTSIQLHVLVVNCCTNLTSINYYGIIHIHGGNHKLLGFLGDVIWWVTGASRTKWWVCVTHEIHEH